MNNARPICIAFSAAGARLAIKLKTTLIDNPWRGHRQLALAAPPGLLARLPSPLPIAPYSSLNKHIASCWHVASGLIFIGAAGIAVRAIAPFMRHKQHDPPVLVIDPSGKHVISLLSGHWGGGNDFARHIASLIDAEPVITTASDASDALSLDLCLQAAGLRILDWQELPAMQARLLEGQCLTCGDPWHALPPLPGLRRKRLRQEPDILIHWRKSGPRPGSMRVALPIIHIGIGMRKNATFETLKTACAELLDQWRIESGAIAALATVKEKTREPALLQLSEDMHIPIRAFDANLLAAISTPNPSCACGRRFDLPPFSVCEAAALASAQNQAMKSFLLAGKQRYGRCIALAIAIASTLGGGGFNTWQRMNDVRHIR